MNFLWFLQFVTAWVSLSHTHTHTPEKQPAAGQSLIHCLPRSESLKDEEDGFRPTFPMQDEGQMTVLKIQLTCLRDGMLNSCPVFSCSFVGTNLLTWQLGPLGS